MALQPWKTKPACHLRTAQDTAGVACIVFIYRMCEPGLSSKSCSADKAADPGYLLVAQLQSGYRVASVCRRTELSCIYPRGFETGSLSMDWQRSENANDVSGISILIRSNTTVPAWAKSCFGQTALSAIRGPFLVPDLHVRIEQEPVTTLWSLFTKVVLSAPPRHARIKEPGF